MTKKISVIDMGYNSLKLVNYVIHDNTYTISSQHSSKVKLGQDLHTQKSLKEEAIKRTIDSLKYFKEIIYFNSSSSLVIPFATSAVRESNNQEYFLDRVYNETGFRFKILSEKEEAIYSYIGANNSLCLSDSVFFDIGGGSIEILSTKKYILKKIISLPLGSLKLSQSFLNYNNNYTTTKDKLIKLEEYVYKLLPSRNDLNLSSTNNYINLIGVGGVLRTIAQFDQSIKEYPIQKLHNYYLDQNSLSSIYDHFKDMSYNEILKINEIGKNRAETIVTGLCVIKNLLTKLRIKNLIVSTKGLREGILLYYYNLYRQTLSTKKQQSDLVKKLIINKCKNYNTNFLSKNYDKLLSLLLSSKELKILHFALLLIHNNTNFYNGSTDIVYLKHKFYSIINSDDDIVSHLNHKEQVLLSLSIISIHKSRLIPILTENLNALFRTKSEQIEYIQSSEKISICIEIISLLNKISSKIEIKTNSNKNKKLVSINIILRKKFKITPTILLDKMIKAVEKLFGLSLSYSLINTPTISTKKRKS